MSKNKFVLSKFILEILIYILYFALYGLVLLKWSAIGYIPETMDVKRILIMDAVHLVVLIALLCRMEGLSVGQRRILDLLFGFFFSILIVNVLSVALEVTFFEVPIGKIFGVHIVLMVIFWFIGLVWILICHRMYEKYQFVRPAVYIYGRREKESDRLRTYKTIGKFYCFEMEIDGGLKEEKITSQLSQEYVVFVGDVPVQKRNMIIKYCFCNEIECYGVPKISDIYINSADVSQLRDKMLLKYDVIGNQQIEFMVKRALDMVISLILLIVLSPVMLVIAILIKVEDGGPVFYLQDRVTMNNRDFKMMKFRSMYVNAEEGGARLAGKNDNRITKIGKVIRNIHFDELPQLINILKGDMSLVGPRPERREFGEEYSKIIPEFQERLKVRGGLTGYAQIYGRYNSDPDDKLKYDLYYIYNFSISFDLKILILTIRILFQKENTEGIDEDKTNALR